MEIVHKHENVKQLEQKLGWDCIELYIIDLGKDLLLIDFLLAEKPWEEKQERVEDYMFKAGKLPQGKTIANLKTDK